MKDGTRVRVGTREGPIDGFVVSTTKSGTLAIQLPGYSDLIYRLPRHVEELHQGNV